MKNFIYIICLFALFASCVPEVEQENPNLNNENSIVKLDIPDGFDFKTHKKVRVNIEDNTAAAIYDVFIISDTKYSLGNQTYTDAEGNVITEEVFKDDIINKPLFSGVPKNGNIDITLTLPIYTNKVYLRRKENFVYSASVVEVKNEIISYKHTKKSSKSANFSKTEKDILYCVNGSGELFQVDPLDGSLTLISEMPMGSWTAAIDQENLALYSIGRSNPYPLMKYSIVNDTWETVSNLGMGGPRLDYNTNDKLLYFSNNDDLYTISPITGQVINSWKITGLHNKIGGDLAFAEDGTLFLCSFSGLYKLELNGDNVYESTRISADNLPFMPTSMTFDSNKELWLADNSSSSDLIIMDTQTGGWQYNWGKNSTSNTDFNRTINDLTTFKIYNNTVVDKDSDGDGILDSEDSYPDDADKAFEIFTPSKYGKGTIAFEDLWPSYGDYDFNDVALNYKAIAVLNSDNMVVQVDFICNVKSNVAGFKNGFGLEIEGLPSNLVESVSGTKLSHNYITLNANGTEANQQNAVIIFTDDQENFLNETTVSIKFVRPLSTEQIGAAPFNPFLIKNSVRAHEIHLPYYNTTDLGEKIVEINGTSKDLNGNYISDNGFPWALSVIHDFKVPKEHVSIDDAYNYFRVWATSGGLEYKDWYKDNTGFRNKAMLEN